MANYTAADVKALRERTGSGMLDCKKALDEADGDIEKAVELLRVKGLKGVAKREGRLTSNGLVTAKVGDGVAYLVELACETDFVAKADTFIALADKVAAAIAASGVSTTAEALSVPLDGKTVGEVITEAGAVLGEKLELRRIAKVSGENFEIYLHKTNPDLPPQVGVLVGYAGGDAETAHGIAQHIAFADPQYLSKDEVPAETVANERRVAEETARNEHKPEGALPKIIEGRLHGYFKTVALLEQDYAKDNKLSVSQVLKDAGLTLSGFARFRVGA